MELLATFGVSVTCRKKITSVDTKGGKILMLNLLMFLYFIPSMCSLTTLWDLGQSFARFLWHHESESLQTYLGSISLIYYLNKGIHMNISQTFSFSNILQLLSNGDKWFKSWPCLTLTYFQKFLRPKWPVHATCVSLELFSIDWSHRWIPVFCYSIHFWIYINKKAQLLILGTRKQPAL